MLVAISECQPPSPQALYVIAAQPCGLCPQRHSIISICEIPSLAPSSPPTFCTSPFPLPHPISPFPLSPSLSPPPYCPSMSPPPRCLPSHLPLPVAISPPCLPLLIALLPAPSPSYPPSPGSFSCASIKPCYKLFLSFCSFTHL